MNKALMAGIMLLALFAFQLSCKKESGGNNNPCAGVTVAVTATVSNALPNQSNGSITASATGGSGFTFSLNNGSFQNSGNFTNLAAGTYTITAKNSDGCTGSQQFTVGTSNPCTGVTVTVTGTVTNTLIGQTNGSISAAATGGSGFTFSINNGPFQATGVFNNLAAGNYTITAKNSDGCTGSQQFTVGTDNPCAGVTITITGTVINATPNQNNGSITVTATGGSGFTYSLNNGAFQASNTFGNLAAGTYNITAKNSDGCTGSQQFTVGVNDPCASINITVTTAVTTATPCNGSAGSITVTATGSTGFTYNINGGAFQASNVFSNLAVGTYTVIAKDANGCTKSASATVGETAAGTLFSQVRNIVQGTCAVNGCHNSASQQGGMNFSDQCNIIANKDRIKIRAVDQFGTASQMPPPPHPGLTASERQAITNWINAGGGYQN